ncbi:hypothetical protein GCM10008931_42680 [Oceanobacillus oncorhynchi subsp. oncorhynchi]|uniref:hypothetical protein n=1 Tax=Oceanobacillus oncorhynchi TaxID=545501 RepID=UPI0031DF12F5
MIIIFLSILLVAIILGIFYLFRKEVKKNKANLIIPIGASIIPALFIGFLILVALHGTNGF